MNDKKLLSLLEEYGLTNNESKVYLGLLRHGHSTIMELSNRIRLNRSTVHVSVQSLIRKGLVSQSRYGERRILIPESPEKISLLIEHEKMNLKRKEDSLPSLVGSIYDVVSNAKESTQSVVKYIEGVKSISKLYDSILECDVIRSYVNSSKILKFFPENQNKFIDAVRSGKSEIWDLQDNRSRHESFTELAKVNARYHLKYLPPEIKINAMDYLIYEDSIAIVQSDENINAVVIQSAALAENAKVLYDLLWSLLP